MWGRGTDEEVHVQCGGGAQMKRHMCGGRGTDEEVHVQCGGVKRYM